MHFKNKEIFNNNFFAKLTNSCLNKIIHVLLNHITIKRAIGTKFRKKACTYKLTVFKRCLQNKKPCEYQCHLGENVALLLHTNLRFFLSSVAKIDDSNDNNNYQLQYFHTNRNKNHEHLKTLLMVLLQTNTYTGVLIDCNKQKLTSSH